MINSIIYTAVTSLNMIASLFFSDSILQSQINRFFDYKNKDDLKQECCLIILEQKNPDNLIEICHKNQFNYWLFGVLKNQKKYEHSRYNTLFTNKKVIKNKQHIIDVSEYTSENEYELKLKVEQLNHKNLIIRDELRKLKQEKWYDFKILYWYVIYFKKYNSEGKKFRYEDFHKEMNIRKASLFMAIKRVKKRFKDRMKKEL